MKIDEMLILNDEIDENTTYRVVLDKDNFFNGRFCKFARGIDIKGYKEVDTLPPNENQSLWPAYKYINNEWILDEEKLKSIQENINKQESIEKKYFEIDELKKKLSDSDYNAIKCLEEIIKHFASILPLGDYKPIGDNRESWRARINALEEEIKEIEGGK